MALQEQGSFPSALQPTQTKDLYQGNYLDFLDGSIGDTFAQQFLPDVYDKQVSKYGKRTIAGFLKMVSAEMPSTSDQIIWTEQGRLHARYTGCFATAFSAATTVPTATLPAAATASTIAMNDATSAIFSVPVDQEGPNITDIAYRVGQTVMIQRQPDTGTGNDGNRGESGQIILKGIITQVGTRNFRVAFYNADTIVAATSSVTALFTTLVYGSEFAKGTSGMEQTIHPQYETFSNSPIIMKDHFAINGSDTSQIGWVEVTSENGASGYLWYIQSEHENRLRWEDYQELAMLENIKADSRSAAIAAGTQGSSVTPGAMGVNTKARGTEGFFQSLEMRGNLYEDLSTELSTAASTQFTDGQNPFDNILKQMDKQGAIEENMIYMNRDLHLAFDNFLAQQNNYGVATGGVSWGMFDNSKDNALDFGFSGFRRGSYDFYKTDWKYLNDWSTRGGFGDIEGVLIPSGSSTVYDEVAGGNVKRPFLHVRYRSSEADNRKMKSWITGSVGGAYTNDVDELRMHYLTERCLITQAPNNFYLFKS